jgi:hypothetical protein
LAARIELSVTTVCGRKGGLGETIGETRHASGFALVSCLTARWTLSSAASGQDVPGQERDGDDRRRDSDDGDGGGGYDHTAILASLFRAAADYGEGLTTSSFLATMAAKTSCFSRFGTLKRSSARAISAR